MVYFACNYLLNAKDFNEGIHGFHNSIFINLNKILTFVFKEFLSTMLHGVIFLLELNQSGYTTVFEFNPDRFYTYSFCIWVSLWYVSMLHSKVKVASNCSLLVHSLVVLFCSPFIVYIGVLVVFRCVIFIALPYGLSQIFIFWYFEWYSG